MKKSLVVFALILISLNFVACAQKKESKTRITQGNGRSSGATGAPNSTDQSLTNGWNDLNRGGPQEVYLTSQNPDQSARAFLSTFEGYNEGDYGHFNFNSVAMRLSFQGGQIVSQNSRIGVRFWDANTGEPVGYLAGAEMDMPARGSKNGNYVSVVFSGSGDDFTVDGYISNGYFNGKVTYDNGQVLGSFSVPANQSIYGY
jgi:hypothetical protein